MLSRQPTNRIKTSTCVESPLKYNKMSSFYTPEEAVNRVCDDFGIVTKRDVERVGGCKWLTDNASALVPEETMSRRWKDAASRKAGMWNIFAKKIEGYNPYYISRKMPITPELRLLWGMDERLPHTRNARLRMTHPPPLEATAGVSVAIVVPTTPPTTASAMDSSDMTDENISVLSEDAVPDSYVVSVGIAHPPPLEATAGGLVTPTIPPPAATSSAGGGNIQPISRRVTTVSHAVPSILRQKNIKTKADMNAFGARNFIRLVRLKVGEEVWGSYLNERSAKGAVSAKFQSLLPPTPRSPPSSSHRLKTQPQIPPASSQ
jgi:ribosomal protein L35AE/L33A